MRGGLANGCRERMTGGVTRLSQIGSRLDTLSAARRYATDHIAMGVFDVFQIPDSAVEREDEAVLSAAARAGAGIVIRGGGQRGANEGKHAGAQWERWRQAHLDDLLEGMTPMEFILRFTFTHPDMDTNIVGTVNPTHLQDNIDALRQGPLPPELYAEAKRRLAAAGATP